MQFLKYLKQVVKMPKVEGTARYIWGVPEIGVPSNHPFLDGIFPNKNQPFLDYGNPHMCISEIAIFGMVFPTSSCKVASRNYSLLYKPYVARVLSSP